MSTLSCLPTAEKFSSLAQQGNVIPVYCQLAADFETPLSAYLKIQDQTNSFLFESAENTDQGGRWSLVGSSPRSIFSARGTTITLKDQNETRSFSVNKDLLDELHSFMQQFQAVAHGELPPFYGGAIGYLSYDAIEQFEPSVTNTKNDELNLPESLFLIVDTILIFDHKLRRLFVVANAFLDDFSNPLLAYQDACAKINQLIEQLKKPLPPRFFDGSISESSPNPISNTSQEEFEQMVLTAKDYIQAGDVFQVVPSQRFEAPYKGSPVDLYRALRHINPSPYMFLLEFSDFSLVGSSPETHVRVQNGQIDVRPIAGTRWRGATPEEDQALAEDLLSDQKERAEHLMLVDLARNDIGRVSQHGSVRVENFMTIERYSHVMHIVSNVTGQISPDYNSYDVLRATFPAGTVSGAPKIRAMQIINELENSKRCSYSGAIGYFAWDGSHDSCIALRTCLLKDGTAYVQAGAGVVADSDPTYEYKETQNKAKAVLRAISLAKTISPAL